MSKRMTWRYHANKAPKMVSMDDAEQLDKLEAEGWADTPAAFHDADAPVEGDTQGNEGATLDEEQQALLDAYADDPEALNRDELANVAAALGNKVTSRTSKGQLAAMLDAHLQE